MCKLISILKHCIPYFYFPLKFSFDNYEDNINLVANFYNELFGLLEISDIIRILSNIYTCPL